MRILYVEDNSADAELTHRKLVEKQSDWHVDIASTLAEARERLLNNETYDVLLLDLGLPDGSGLSLLTETRQKEQDITVIVLTGTGSEETAVAALKAGADDYVSKQNEYLAWLANIIVQAQQRRRTMLTRRAHTLRVLYVEHNVADIDLTRRHFARHAPHILLDVVFSVAEMLDRLPQTAATPTPYNLLLIDYKLPGLNALEALKAIRHERNLALPVVLVTGQGSEEVVAHALRLGAAEYLVKHPGYLYELPTVLENVYYYNRLQKQQSALQRSEARFRRLVENASDLIYRVLLQPGSRLEYISPASVAFTGYTPEEHYANPDLLRQLIHPDDRYLARNISRGLIASGEPVRMRWRHKDGRIIWTEQRSILIRDEAGNLNAIEGIARDITDRVMAEQLMELQITALNAAANSIVITDADGHIEWINAAFTELTGYTAEEVMGINPRELVRSGVHNQTFYQEMWQTILAGEVWHGQLVNRRKDGSLYHEEQTITPVRDVTGQIKHFIAIKQDITAQKEAEAERALQAERLEQILKTVPDGIVLLDAAALVTLTNPAGQLLLKQLANSEPGETVSIIGGLSLTDLLQSPPHGLSHSIAFEQGHYELLARPIANETAVSGWVLLLRDVTAEQEQEQYLHVQQRLATVGQLASGIAHDFNNVMAVITLYAQLLQNTIDLPVKGQRQLETIQHQAQHATNMIAQILDFSRRSVMERIPLDLLPLLKELVRLLGNMLPETIQISLNHSHRNYIVMADPTRLQQVMMNIALNARDAMPHGGRLQLMLIKRTVTSEVQSPVPDVGPGEWLALTITDEGVGIPPDHLSRIFDPFFTTKEPGQGTGLGLAQVYGIIKQHEGAIDVTSEVGRGTTLTIYLPLFVQPAASSESALPLSDTPVGSERILLVEDNETLRMSVEATLSQLGYQVVEAKNGRDALAVLEQNGTAVDLVLTDVVMPEMGGVELCRILGSRYPNLPLLLMTGYPLNEQELSLSGLSQIQKPFTIELLGRRLRDLLDAASIIPNTVDAP